MPLQAAQQRSLDRLRLEEQLGRLGGSGWVLERLELDLEGDLFLPVAELNRMRRELLEQLQQPSALVPSQGPLQSSEVDVPFVLRQLLPETCPQPSTDQTGLVVLVRSLAQLEALIPLTHLPIASVVADLEPVSYTHLTLPTT